MSGYLLPLLLLIQSTVAPAPKDDIKESLAKAEALYFEARFSDSIQLLMNVSDQLQSKPDRMADKIKVKLQLALANIGMNDTDKAKSFLVEMYSLDPNTVLDPQQFSPKVITLAADAKAISVKQKCQAVGDEARTNLKQGNAVAMIKLLGSPDLKCVDMAAISSEAADLLYKTGMEAYKTSDYSTSVQTFQAALKFSPKHELATQYLELAQGRLQVAEDRAVIQWQKSFDAQNLPDAAEEYRKIAAFNDPKLSPMLRQASEQYRKKLTSLVDSWNQACPAGDNTVMTDIRKQITDLLPDPNFGEDIRSHMMSCIKPVLKTEAPPETRPTITAEAKPEVRSVPMTGSSNQCLQLDYRVAMTRIIAKSKVDPEIPREARSYIQGGTVTVKVRIRIDETGTVVSTDTPGGNPMFNNAVRNAVEHWKFTPALDASGPRCVDTDIPIQIGPLNSR
jgi:TonB family protein